ncbi:MAG: ABC transporter permease, partial [Bacteroidota bacterium]
LVICLLAAGLGILLAEFLLPRYNQMWSYVDLDLSLDYFSDTSLIPFLIGTVLLTALLGGAYPAFYISSFQPSHIFRGNTKFGGDGWLVRSLLGLQIVISLVAIIGGITFAQNAAFQENFDFGYDIDGIINVSVNDANSYEKFKNAIASNPDILGVTGSRNNLGFGNWWSNIGKLEDNRHAQVQLVGPDFFEVVGLSLIEGRPFDKNRETDYTDAVIINRKLMKQQQWESGLGQTIDMYGKKKKVIGVVEDFHPSNLFDPMSPNVFHFEKPDRFQTMKIKVPAPKMLETKTYLSETWAATFPFVPFEGYFQDETLFQSLTVTKNIAYIYLFLSIITVLLAATGLFSLVSLNFLKRAKEIAVRRVLGASPSNIAINLNKHYLLIFAIGCFLGGALGGFNAKFLMEQIFATNNGVSNNAILLSAVGICLIGALTIGGKLLNVLRTNPAETLKSE